MIIVIVNLYENNFLFQIIIFPEGTCTNRSCLITFKQGAFYPGVPIQPVCIRYPNKLDTVTWTWEGPGVYENKSATLEKFKLKSGIILQIEIAVVNIDSNKQHM